MNRALRAVGGVALVLQMLWPAKAEAFCRTTTVAVVSDFQPSPTRCWDQGTPLYWRRPCIGYGVQRDASRQVSFDDAANILAQSFTKWTGASCPSGGSGRSRASIDIRDLGAVACDTIGYNQTGANQNVIVFRDSAWPHNDTNNTLALTTVTFNPNTGEIYDADMEINSHDQQITLVDPVPANSYDFASIVTHEAGHFLGLAHSGLSHATMYASYTPSSTAMRELTSDDIAGICAAYRADGSRPPLAAGEEPPSPLCDPNPRRGFISECAEDPRTSCLGTSQIANNDPVAPAWLLLSLGVLAAATVRRDRTRRAND